MPIFVAAGYYSLLVLIAVALKKKYDGEVNVFLLAGKWFLWTALTLLAGGFVLLVLHLLTR